jgi:hypothetical protein
VWDLESGETIRTLRGHTDLVTAVALTADGRRVVSGSRDHTLRVWDLKDRKELVTFTIDGVVTACTVARCIRTIVAGDGFGRVHFLRLEGVSIAAGVTQETQEISVDNTAICIGENRWSWKVFLKASPQVLQNIECVQYTLHHTFRNPVQRVCTIGDENYPFAYSATGWGMFEIQIRVFMKDGQKKDLTYNLRF